MPPVGFGLTISAGELLKTYALDRVATGTGHWVVLRNDKLCSSLADRIIMMVKSKDYDYFRRTGMHTYVG
jgi:hypothetical protein